MKKISALGLIILISISPVFRGLISNFETSAFFAIFALLFILYFFDKVIKKEAVIINKWFMGIGLLMIAAYALSFINAVNVRENISALIQYIELFMMFIVLYDYFRDGKKQFILHILLPMVAVGFVCAVSGLEQLAGLKFWIAMVKNNRISAVFQYANTASLYFAICILFSIALANLTRNVILRALLTGVGNIMFLAFLLTGSRGGYIAGIAVILLFLAIQPSGYRIRGIISFLCISLPIVIFTGKFNTVIENHNIIAANMWLIISFALSFALYLVFSSFSDVVFKNKSVIKMPKSILVTLSVTFIILIFLVFLFRDRLIVLLPEVLGNRLKNLSITDINVVLRLDYDKDALRIIKDNWLLGLGRGGWQALFQSVQEYFHSTTTVHNNYLEVFIEAGILGFLSYVALLMSSLFNSISAFIKSTDIQLKILSSGLVCGLIAIAVHSSFDFDMSFVSMSLLLFVLFAVSAPYIPDSSAVLQLKSSYIKYAVIILCSVLFTINSLYFTSALNEYSAQKYMSAKDYKNAAVYYEEAIRLDTLNSTYAFELAKLYYYFANETENLENKTYWLEKARSSAEKSVDHYKYFPYQIDTLTQIYLASDMPLQALENAQKLIKYQKYRTSNYELLAQSYIAAAAYYEKENNLEKTETLLENCLKIDKDPYLRKSANANLYSLQTSQPKYIHSKKLAGLLDKASKQLEKLKAN